MSLINLFRPKWKHRNNEIRANAVKKLADQRALAYVAKNDDYWDVRKIAAGKLTDQDLLADIVKNDKNISVRIAALEKLTDQVLLADVAKKNINDLGIVAADKLNDKFLAQTVYTTIAKNDKDEWERKNAVGRLTDQVVLAEIAKTDISEKVRAAAMKELSDQEVLSEIARMAKHEDVREAAVRKLTDQAVLSGIAKADISEKVRATAVESLIDQSVLSEIARTDKHEDVRRGAVRNITDQAVLSGIAKADISEKVRATAVGSLTDQVMLSDIARTDRDESVRKAASWALKKKRISIFRTQWEKKMEDASTETLIAIIREMGGVYEGDGFDNPVHDAIKKLERKGIPAVESVIRAFGNDEMLARWRIVDLRERVAPHLIGETIFNWLQTGYKLKPCEPPTAAAVNPFREMHGDGLAEGEKSIGDDAILAAATKGDRILAMKLYRDLHGGSLAEAKRFIDELLH